VGSTRRTDTVLGGQSRMIQFIWGALLGLSVGYPLGLWAIGYSNKEKINGGK
jgi:hypothetical protein